MMVCMDGFILTHAFERVDIPTQEQVDAFLPPFVPRQVLDPDDPMTIGAMVGPEAFTEVRYLMHAKQMQALDEIPVIADDFEAAFGRPSGGLLRSYRSEDAETVVVALGSVLGTIEDVVDELRDEGVAIGALGIKCFRPCPARRGARGAAPRQARRRRGEGVRRRRRRHRRPERAARAVGPADARLRRRRRPRRPADHAGVAARALRRRARRTGSSRLHFLDLDWDVVERELERMALPRSGPHAENILRDSARGAPTDAVPADQVLPDRQLRGRQPAARPRAALRAGRHWALERADVAGTAPARAAARRSARATCSTPRCAPPSGKLVAANATGCLEVFSTPYPETSWQLALAALAVRQRAGRRRRRRRRAARPRAARTSASIGQGGDGGTVDIGFGCLSGMFERNDDVLFVCYDNEGYMNTGVQRSGATPPAARTATTQAVGPEPGNVVRPGQERAADRDGARDPLRRHRDRRRPARPRVQGRARDGVPRRALPARLRALPARLGLRLRGHDQARPAGQGDRHVPGLRGRARRGHRACRRSAARSRSRSTCACRGATPTCSATRARATTWSTGSRRGADRNIARFGLLPDEVGRVMEKPFAITLDVGSSRANKTGSWRTERPVLRRPDAAVQRRLPGRREHPGLALPRRGGRLRARLAHDHGGQPVPRGHGPGLLPPVRDRLQPRAARRGGRDQLRRAVPRRRGDPAGLDASRSTAPPTGKRVLVVGAGPSGLSAAYHLARRGHDGDDPRGRPDGRRHDALRDPDATACRATSSTPRSSGSSTSASTLELDAKVTDLERAMREGELRRRRSSPSAPSSASAPTSRPARRRRSSTRSPCCAAWRASEKPLLGRRVAVYGGGNTAMDAARTAKRLGADRGGRRLPPHPRPDARPRLRGRGGARGGRADASGCPRSSRSTRASSSSSRWSSTRPASRSRPASSRSSRPTRSSSRSARRPTSRCSTASPGIEVDDGVVEVDARMMTGHPGIFAGGDMVPAERTVTVGDRPRQAGRAQHRRVAARRRRSEHAAAARARRPSTRSTPGTTPTRRATVRPQLELVRRQSTFDEVRRRPRRVETRCSRRAAACPAATASPATTATASAPTTR